MQTRGVLAGRSVGRSEETGVSARSHVCLKEVLPYRPVRSLPEPGIFNLNPCPKPLTKTFLELPMEKATKSLHVRATARDEYRGGRARNSGRFFGPREAARRPPSPPTRVSEISLLFRSHEYANWPCPCMHEASAKSLFGHRARVEIRASRAIRAIALLNIDL